MHGRATQVSRGRTSIQLPDVLEGTRGQRTVFSIWNHQYTIFLEMLIKVFFQLCHIQRSWIFVGYACRVAFELGLDKFVEKPPPGETEAQYLERRNKERTFLVLFVHDRSLSMQTGRPWMIPEVRLMRLAQLFNCFTEKKCQNPESPKLTLHDS